VARRPQQDAYPKLDIPTSPDKNALPINVSGENSLFSIAVIVVLYLLLGTVSIAIDRRALMVSTLAYVLYAFSDLLQVCGMVSLSLAVSGVFIGSMLLLLAQNLAAGSGSAARQAETLSAYVGLSARLRLVKKTTAYQ